MEPLTLARQEVVVGGLLEQRVAERVVAGDVVRGRPGNQDLAADGVAQRRRAGRRPSSPATCASRSWSTRRPATAATPMTVWARSGRATIRASRTSRRVGGSRPPSASVPGPEQLLDEERVAVRAPVDLLDEVG